MKNVRNVHYWQVNHEVKKILGAKGVIILPSPKAWERFKWTRKWFDKKPKEGYFIWVKKELGFPLSTCITIASPKISQDINNLMVVEKDIKIKANMVCNAAKNNLCGRHYAQGSLILKDNASLEYSHFHQWGEKDFVSPNYQFILGENSRLVYTYKNLFPPKNLELKTTIHGGKNSSANLNFVINGLNSKIGLEEVIFLEKEKAQGLVKLRVVGRKNSQIKAISKIVAKSPGRGHLDCQGLLVDKNSNISLIPELICQNKDAQITHEASIGKISEEELNYLRMKGLSEEEAIKLITTGFLGK
jgi:Fe-S cluster assembly scaffold protein SufB